MFRRSALVPLILAAALVPAAASATDNDLRSVAGMAHHVRVLLVFAPTLQDPRLATQRADMARFALGAAERDLTFVQVAEDRVLGARDDARRLRRRFRVPPAGYRTLLIGKDGDVAIDEPAPIATARLQTAIDAMPMRKEEIARARAGLGKPAD